MVVSKRIKIKITPKLKTTYPNVVFGNLIIRNVSNIKEHEALEEQKRSLERKIRETYSDTDGDRTIQSYNAYFKKWSKNYPIEFQIKTIKSGSRFPKVSVLVDSMFLAELKNRFLTSGHDLDTITGDLVFDVSASGELYVKLNNEEQELKNNDVVLKDSEGILASILYGPARRTAITLDTKNAIYFAWFPHGASGELIERHLNDIISNLRIVFNSVEAEIQIHQ